MTQLLEDAIKQVQQRTNDEQDAIASLILAELADEDRWNAAFAGSQDELSQLADQVRDRIREGRVRQGGFDEL
jgi:hypothetical protein